MRFEGLLSFSAVVGRPRQQHFAGQLEQKRHYFFMLLYLLPLQGYAQNTFQLAPPYLRYTSVFFEKEALVDLEFAQAGTQIHYTTNGLEPTQKDPVFKKTIRLKKSGVTLKAKAFGAGFLSSETVEATFYSKGLEIESISTTPPHERYPGSGNGALIDGRGGITAYSSKTWLGFQKDTVILLLTLSKPQKAKDVLLHVLQNQNAWIFAPLKVEVLSPKKKGPDWDLIASKTFEETEKAPKPACEALIIPIPPHFKTDHFMLKIYPQQQLPAWHPGKGNPAWLFLDEVRLW